MNEIMQAVNRVTRFLARRDSPGLSHGAADLIILLGNSMLEPAAAAADALRRGVARELLVSGGIGHATPYLVDTVRAEPSLRGIPVEGRPEADILFDVLTRRLGVPPGKILVENRSANCGDNAAKSLELLAERRPAARTFVLMQDPVTQQRTHASFTRLAPPELRFLSWAPFIPLVGETLALTGSEWGRWDERRFYSLFFGERPRLRDDAHGYGPAGRGFIDHVDVPPDVEAAWEAAECWFRANRPEYLDRAAL